MNEKSIEVRILDRLVWTFIFCIVAGMVGVVFNVVKVEYMEGLISGFLITKIGDLMKDLFFNEPQGGTDVPSDPKLVKKADAKPGGEGAASVSA